MLWSVAAAEMRSTRRLARTWVFIVVAALLCVGQWLNLSVNHALSSYMAPAAGIIGPRYLVVAMGAMAMFMFTVGIVFMAFDIRTRDVKDRIGEAIDSRPFSNFSLLTGRLIGIVLVSTIAVVAIFLFIVAFGWLAESAGWTFGSSIEPTSVISFLLWDVIPNLALWGSLTIFLAIVLRVRLLVVVVALGLMVALFYFSTRIPYFVSAALSTYSNSHVFPSDLLPRIFHPDVMVNRFSLMLIAVGFLALAAAWHPRQERAGRRPILFGTGASLLVLGVVGIVALYFSQIFELQQVREWATLHQQHHNSTQTDIERVEGEVAVIPGRRISLDLTITLDSTSAGEADKFLFSLNPGYQIQKLSLDGADLGSSDYSFAGGLLTVPRESVSSKEQLRIVAEGVPDSSFAYLDGSLDWSELDSWEAESLYFFGQENYIFHPNYFALMPGVSWFPASGSAYGRTEWETRPQDFFEVDIEVEVPQGWLVAGPGTRELVTDGPTTRYRFNPRISIPELALLGSKFVQRSLAVDGTIFELLLNERHVDNLQALEPVVPALTEWISERQIELNKAGLKYPFETLTFVEVPVSLKVYGGGWRMDSVYSPPGIQMLRESGFPTARFDNALNRTRDKFEAEEYRSEFLLWLVGTFFENDYHGGNPFISLPKNLVSYQAMPEGPGATALSFVVGEIVNRLCFERTGYFSLHMATSRADFAGAMNTTASAGYFGGIGEFNWRERFSNLPTVWDSVLAQALSDIDYHADPRAAYHALLLKGSSVAESILEGFGAQKVGLFLSELTTRYRGRTYTDQEFLSTALDMGMDIQSLLGDWLHGTGLPGFVVADPRVERLQDTPKGEAVYQTSFVLRNDEPVPGLVSIAFQGQWEVKKHRETNRMEPIRIEGDSAVRVVFQNDTPVHQVWIEPHLSLNRESLLISLPPADNYEPTDSPALPYVTEVAWTSQDADAVIVDDLDLGFAIATDEVVEESRMPSWLAYLVALPDPEFDSGLPTLRGTWDWQMPFDNIGSKWLRWYRDNEPTSYGKYRHTYAVNPSGSSLSTSTFSAHLPSVGTWNLEYHVPNLKNQKGEWKPEGGFFNYRRFSDFGNHLIEVQAGNGVQSVEFDLNTASKGWNDIGTFDVESPKVAVIVTQALDGNGIADAVRWTRTEATSKPES